MHNYHAAKNRFPMNVNWIWPQGTHNARRNFASHLLNMAPYMEETSLSGAIKWCDPNDPACVEPGYQKVNNVSVAQVCGVLTAMPQRRQERSRRYGGSRGYWNSCPIVLPQVATTNYAGSIGSQKMESWKGFVLSTVVGNGGAKYDNDDDGEDWFNQNTKLGYACQTGAARPARTFDPIAPTQRRFPAFSPEALGRHRSRRSPTALHTRSRWAKSGHAARHFSGFTAGRSPKVCGLRQPRRSTIRQIQINSARLRRPEAIGSGISTRRWVSSRATQAA